MNETQIKPLISTKETFRRSFGIYFNHFGKIALVSVIPNAIAFLLWQIFQAVFTIGRLNAGSFNVFVSITNVAFIVSVILFITTIIVALYGIVAIIYTVVQHEKATVVDAFEHAFRYLWAYILQSIAVSLYGAFGIFLGALVMLIIGIILGFLSFDLMNSLFLWLTLIPTLLGLLFSSMVLFAQFSIIDKNHKVREAIRYSWSLTRPVWTGFISRIIVISFIIAVISLALQSLNLLGSLISILTLSPFGVIYLYVLYADRAGIAILKDTQEVMPAQKN
jgi:hypothetical protein